LTASFIFSVAVVPRIEARLPARAAIAATLRFRAGYKPRTEEIQHFLAERGLSIPQDSLTITHDAGCFELQCVLIASTVARSAAMNRIGCGTARQRIGAKHLSKACKMHLWRRLFFGGSPLTRLGRDVHVSACLR
jgi:hypothetical protein